MKNICLLTLIIMLTAPLLFAVNPREMKFPPLQFEPANPVRFEIDNGIVIYFLEDHQLPVFSVTGYFNGGSVHDPKEKLGLSDLTATLMRSGGAGKRSPEQVDLDLDFISANTSSDADKDYFSISVSALKKDIALCFEIFSDMLIRPRFDSGKIALELANARERIRRQNDDPGRLTRRVYYQTVYEGHPYSYYPTLATLDNITEADIRAHYEKFYNPDNCILAVSGDMTLDELQSLLATYLMSWEKAGVSIEAIPEAKPKYRPGVYYVEKDINQAHLCFGHLSMDSKNPDRYAMDILNFAMGGGGFSSRLMMQVRTSAGLAYLVGSYLWTRPLNGTLFGYCQTRADAMSQALRMMLDIMADVKAGGITREEMDLAKESIINSYVFNYDTPSKIVEARAMLELMGFPSDQIKKNLEEYRRVTLEDCNEAARKYIDMENLAVVITGNRELFDKSPETFGTVTAVSLEIK
ncbi:MAG: insulinase family protein [Candidatus Zixiibacteriota bacterium]|nr:MAG: insulinase family protein [candidate division Zixibacteria bacterium]